MTKHTPGPWKINHGKRGLLGQAEDTMKPFTFIQSDFHASGKIKNGPEAGICEMKTGERAVGVGNGSFYHHITDEEVEANARLIAAAPDLLAALEKIIEEFNPTRPDWHLMVSSEGQRMARAAIAKAKEPPL